MPGSRPALLYRYQPDAPWRAEGAPHAPVLSLVASDTFFGSLCHAFSLLGELEEWLGATCLAETPSVRLSSLFPFHHHQLFVPPPASHYPPEKRKRLRPETIRFVPAAAARGLLGWEEWNESRWVTDLATGCLLPADRAGQGSPYRAGSRTRTAVDRMHGGTAVAANFEIVEFAPRAGLWGVAVFQDEAAESTWEPRLRAALRLLADTGIGGGRALGWGHAAQPQFRNGEWPQLVLGEPPATAGATGWWLFSLYAPGPAEPVDLANGAYGTTVRGGYTVGGQQKLPQRMMREGSVIACAGEPIGQCAGVGPAAYRWGVALAVEVAV